MAKIKAFKPGSVGKIFALLYGIMGFIMGVVAFLVALVSAAEEESVFGLLFGAILFFLLPLGYGLLGLVFGYVSAWLYNVAAKRVGGIEVEVE